MGGALLLWFNLQPTDHQAADFPGPITTTTGIRAEARPRFERSVPRIAPSETARAREYRLYHGKKTNWDEFVSPLNGGLRHPRATAALHRLRLSGAGFGCFILEEMQPFTP